MTNINDHNHDGALDILLTPESQQFLQTLAALEAAEAAYELAKQKMGIRQMSRISEAEVLLSERALKARMEAEGKPTKNIFPHNV
jgi:hypothetical protein